MGGYSYIGVDAGKSSIKISQFKGKALVKAAAREIPVSVRKGPKNAMHAFIEKSVAELIRDKKFRGKFVMTNLSPPAEVQLINLNLPHMSRTDMRGAIDIEIMKNAASGLPGGASDFSVSEAGKDGSHRVVAVVGRREAINGKIALFENTGLGVRGFLTTGFALESLLKSAEIPHGEENFLFINLGASITSLNFFKNSTLAMSREIFSGSDDITMALCRSVWTEKGSVDVSYENAENIKRTFGLMENAPEVIAGRIPSSQLSALIRPFIERLLKEINRLIGQTGGDAGVPGIRKIYLCGGGAKLKGLPEAVQKETGIETLVFDPGKALRMALPPEELKVINDEGFDFSVACGLALCKKPGIDLVPNSIKVLQRASRLKKGALVGSVIIALTAGGYYVSVSSAVDEYNRLLKDGRRQIEPLLDKLEYGDELMYWRERVSERERTFLKYSRQPSFHGILKELSNITPQGVKLVKMELDDSSGPKMMKIEGLAASSEADLGSYLTSLENSPFFSEVTLRSMTGDDGRGESFEISFNLIY